MGSPATSADAARPSIAGIQTVPDEPAGGLGCGGLRCYRYGMAFPCPVGGPGPRWVLVWVAHSP